MVVFLYMFKYMEFSPNINIFLTDKQWEEDI